MLLWKNSGTFSAPGCLVTSSSVMRAPGQGAWLGSLGRGRWEIVSAVGSAGSTFDRI